MKNITIERTNNNTYVVYADTERFGKHEIMFEGISEEECKAFIKNVKEAIAKTIIEKVAEQKKEQFTKFFNRCYALTGDCGWYAVIERYDCGWYAKFEGTKSAVNGFMKDGEVVRKPRTAKLIDKCFAYVDGNVNFGNGKIEINRISER